VTEFVFVTQSGNLYLLHIIILGYPDYQHGEKSQRSCLNTSRTFYRLFSLPLSSSRWEEINTNGEI